jgi:hypothetical protein
MAFARHDLVACLVGNAFMVSSNDACNLVGGQGEKGMTPTLWIVQTNLGDSTTHDAIKSACEANGLLFRGVDVIPFSDELPDIEYDGPVLAYGATRFIRNVANTKKWKPGAFFDERMFTITNCLHAWGDRMANSDSVIVRLDSVASLPYQPTDDVFVRPNGDLKQFAGDVMAFKDLCGWAATIGGGGFEIDGSLLVAVATPKWIKAEWRIFAVEGGRAIAATRYRLDGRLAPSADVPEAVVSFVEARLKEWMPAPAVALDVAEVENDIRILELSDIHSAGHYAADIEAIVVETSRVAERHWRV